MQIPKYLELLVSVIVCMLYAVPHLDDAIFRTKRPRYIMRGELRMPSPPEDYCRKGLCPEGVNHIACNNPFWGPKCTKPRDGINMDYCRTLILDLHNNIRKLVSTGGTKKNLPKVKYLPKLTWDNELSILAMRSTNFCDTYYTQRCANTARFLNVATNFCSLFLEKENHYVNATEIIKYAIERYWFDYNSTDVSYVYSFPSTASAHLNYTANVINQNVRYVGCGMLVRIQDIMRRYYFVCLYNEQPKPGHKLYDVHI